MSTKKQKTPLIKKPKTPLALTPLALWLGAQGVRLDGVRIDSDSTTGALRLVSTRAIGEEEAIIVVPKSAVLSVKTATNQAVEALLDEAALDKPGGFPDSAVQTLVVAFERSKGAASRWHDYLESMREVADLPILWSEDELALLRGTGLDVAARTWRAELAREHRTITRALREAGQHVGAEGAAMARLPLVSYVHAATLMASRGFFVDDSHGDGLVPAIDVANHKCALAPEGDGDSEEEEEEEEAAEAEEAEEEAEAEAEAKEEEGEGGLGPRSLRAAGPALRAAAAAVAGDASCLQMDCTFVGDEEEEGEDEDEDEEDEENAEDEGEEGEGGGRGVEEGGTKETKESGEGEGEEEEDEEDEDEEEDEEEDDEEDEDKEEGEDSGEDEDDEDEDMDMVMVEGDMVEGDEGASKKGASDDDDASADDDEDHEDDEVAQRGLEVQARALLAHLNTRQCDRLDDLWTRATRVYPDTTMRRLLTHARDAHVKPLLTGLGIRVKEIPSELRAHSSMTPHMSEPG